MGSGSITKTGNGTLTLTGTNNTYTGATFINEGTLQVAVNNLPTGNNAFNFGDLIFDQNVDAEFTGGVFGTGAVTKIGAGRLTLTRDSDPGGSVVIAAGTLAVNAPAGSATGFSQVTVTGGSIFGGSGLSGGKTLVSAGGTLTPSLLPGQLVLGEVEFQSASSLLFEIDMGFASDLLVNEAAVLAGDLAIDLLDDFEPEPSDVFTILIANSLTGSFANVADGGRLETAGGEGSFLVSYSSVIDSVVLSDFNIAGDLDFDGDVDGDDFLAWQRNPSIGDLVDWQSNYGNSSSSLAATSSAVPEPNSMTILLVLTAAIAGGCRYRW